MKRQKLLRHLKRHGAFLVREGRRHSIYARDRLKTEVPRHYEIVDELGKKCAKIWIYLSRGELMKYRAVIKKAGDWWIGWLLDLPGVNAQEKTREKLIASLRVGAEDMLATEVQFELGRK